MEKIYLLYGEYDDKSGVKIPRAYRSKEMAERDLDLIHECEPCSSLNWEIVEVSLFDEQKTLTR